jgi:hypothetical protein
MCKSQKRGWDDKKTFTDLRRAVAHEQDIRDWEQGAGLTPEDFRGNNHFRARLAYLS